MARANRAICVTPRDRPAAWHSRWPGLPDHSGAKRCSACTEAWQVINGLLTTGGATAFGIRVDGNDVGSGSAGLTGTSSGRRRAASWSRLS
jgi:hypothetical protein